MGADLEERFRPPAEVRPAVRALSLELLEVLRPIAQDLGYALGVHGSLERDLDIIAAPWTGKAPDARAFVKKLTRRLSKARGAQWYWSAEPTLKPHGRLAFTLISIRDGISSSAGQHPFIDLSVMPKVPNP